MLELWYGGILIGSVTTNRSMTVEEMLVALGTTVNEIIEKNGWECLDYNKFEIESLPLIKY